MSSSKRNRQSKRSGGYVNSGTSNLPNMARRMFTKLIKDKDAVIRSKRDVYRFIQGMDSYESKAKLLQIVEDTRYLGIQRVEDCLSMLDSLDDIDMILVPLITNFINEETTRPLSKRMLNRVVSSIFNVPGLIEFLKESDFATLSPLPSVHVLCKFLETSVMMLVEARNSDSIKDISKDLRKREVEGSQKLCALLLIDSKSAPLQNQSRDKIPDTSNVVGCWVTDMKPPGGRHDNDFENYRDVNLVPTNEEISCEESSWLPLASGENAYIEDEEMRMLDANFRLLREDSVSTMKNNIAEKKRLWRNARIIDVSCTLSNKGGRKPGMAPLSFLVQVDRPSGGKKETNWERSRSLPHGGIVAFCKDDKVVKMATITIRRHDVKGEWLNASTPIIGISFHTEKDFLSSLQEITDNMLVVARMNEIESNLKKISSSKRADDKVTVQGLEIERQKIMEKFTSYDLIEASSSFFSYKPTLLALKDLKSIPLARELVTIEPSTEPPNYVPRKMVMPKKIFKDVECDLDNWSNEYITTVTSLDQSQADALRCALSSRVALIQGPPGTGKTFIGSLVAQMIRENTDETILCVCYTNHALDQFLEHLHDAGERRMVRIGGMSKSEKVAPYQVRELARSKSKFESQASRRMGATVAQLHKCHEEMQNLIDTLKQPLQWDKPSGGVCNLLQYDYPDIYRYFVMMESEGDFRIVGKRNQELTPAALFQNWKNGMPCPPWLQDYIHLDPEVIDFWEQSRSDRSNLVRRWHDEIFDEIKATLKEKVVEYEELNKEKQAISMEKDLDILKDARIIGATTSGAAKYRDILALKSAGVVIVEEAGEVLEAHVLSTLSQATANSEETKHLILIGDHLQLRPKVENHRLATVSGTGYNLDCSLFERLIKKKFPSTMLQVQHRMRPSISEFVRKQTYPTLQDHPSVFDYPNVLGVQSNFVFINHEQPEDNARSRSELFQTTKSNSFEANMAVKVVRHFLLQGYSHSQITILTPYVGQIKKIMEVMKKSMSNVDAYINDLDREELLRDTEEDEIILEDKKQGPARQRIRCASIDNFQGEESDIIIVSLVRSNSLGNIGFLKEEQRVNVLLSRARHGLFMIGNSKTLKQSSKGAHVWKPILDTLQKRGALLNGLPTICPIHADDGVTLISQPADFDRYCPNGGCLRPCKARLECGHVCPQACHPIDKRHILAHKQCCEPCRRFPPECTRNHACTKLCKDKCGPCETIVEPTMLPCGHVMKKPKCHDVRNETAKVELTYKCKEMVNHTFEKCGHISLTTCGNSRLENPICSSKCGKILDCGHACNNSCQSCSDKHSCGKKCERSLFCGHVCNKECHGDSECGKCTSNCETNCPHSTCQKLCSNLCHPCVEVCDWQCDHMGKCPLVCGAPCTRLPCQKRCTKTLACGHQCPSICGEDCPSVQFCFTCCKNDEKTHIVDMICFTQYQNHDVNEDPIIVLPCKHFYSASTLDGLFEISQAYELDENGDFVGVKSLIEHCDAVKPKTCPDCRAVVHSTKRYGRLLSFIRLRVLERKHIMSIERSLQMLSKKLETEGSSSNVEKSLKRIEKDISKGPMKKIFEACNADAQVEVPSPPTRPTIQLMKLMAKSQQMKIETKHDEAYENTIQIYKTAINLCDKTKSTRFGAEIRLSVVKTLLIWDSVDEVKGEIATILGWISTMATQFQDIIDQVNQLKEDILNPKNTLAEVVGAMNTVDGHDYGGSWTSHWYECPNGHPYFIGDCGGAMETARCIECGEQVGGGGHQLLGSNRSVSGIVREVLNN